MYLCADQNCLLTCGTNPALLVWYAIDDWLDYQLRIIAVSSQTGSELLRPTRTSLPVTAAFLLLCAILGIAPTYHHRTGETNFLFAAVMLWPVSYLGFSIWGERRHTAQG
jgi:hypothetical protein